MYAMEQFAQSSTLLIVLSVLSVFSSGEPYLCLLFSGLLLIIFAIRSLSEEESLLLYFVQFGVMIAFLLLSGSLYTYLIFYEMRLTGRRAVQVFLPAFVYGVVQSLVQEQSVSQVICSMIFLAVFSFLIYIVEKMVLGYLFARNQMLRTVSVTAVNEMYEKKLNQELVLKNYLADKNARLEERENISRSIHNNVGHSITAAIMALDAADMLFDTAPGRAREKMNTANERIRGSLDTIRHAVRILASEKEWICMEDFAGRLEGITEQFSRDAMVQVRTDFPDAESSLSIPQEHAEFLIGAVQESLVNGVRHGEADRFTISLVADSRHVRMNILDNGRSDFSEQNAEERIQNGFGLKKLSSYAERCGGMVSFSNNNGFRTILTLPLDEEEPV